MCGVSIVAFIKPSRAHIGRTKVIYMYRQTDNNRVGMRRYLAQIKASIANRIRINREKLMRFSLQLLSLRPTFPLNRIANMTGYEDPVYVSMRNILLGLGNSLHKVDTAENAENWAGLFSRYMVRISFAFITDIPTNRIQTGRLE
jgi:hypothetical protein